MQYICELWDLVAHTYFPYKSRILQWTVFLTRPTCWQILNGSHLIILTKSMVPLDNFRKSRIWTDSGTKNEKWGQEPSKRGEFMKARWKISKSSWGKKSCFWIEPAILKFYKKKRILMPTTLILAKNMNVMKKKLLDQRRENIPDALSSDFIEHNHWNSGTRLVLLSPII